MTDDLSVQQPASTVNSEPTAPDGNTLAHIRHKDEIYEEAVAYARHLEHTLADYQTEAARNADYIRKLEAELAKFQSGTRDSVERSLSSAYQDAVAYARHLEQTHDQTLSYVRTLEKTVAEFQAASVSNTNYVTKLEDEITKIQKSYADATEYAHSLAAYVRQLEIKIDDLEENLRQYQET